MSTNRTLQPDLVIPYQQAVISTVLCALRQSHGADFAASFVSEYRHAILVAALWQTGSHNEPGYVTASRLGVSSNGR